MTANGFAQSIDQTHQTGMEKTIFQAANIWKPGIDARSDVAIAYGTAFRSYMSFERRVQLWRDKGYTVHFMNGIAWGDYQDYFSGEWDGINHIEEGIARYKELGTYYESLSKNIDADNDGIPDNLADKQLSISTLFSTQGGQWGINDIAASVVDTSQLFINYMVLLNGGKGLTFSDGKISFSGPEESPSDNISMHGYRLTPDGPQGFLASFKRAAFISPPGAPDWNVLLPFKKGAYTLTLDDNKFYSLNYSNISSKYYLVLIIPTLHTNEEGKLVSISLEYKLPDNLTIVNPTNILTSVMVHLGNPQEFYNSPWLTNETGFTVINLSTPLDILSLHHVDIFYDDILGNQYDIIWQ